MSRPFLVSTGLTCFHCPVEERIRILLVPQLRQTQLSWLPQTWLLLRLLGRSRRRLLRSRRILLQQAVQHLLRFASCYQKKKEESWKTFSTQSLIEGSDSILVLVIGLKYLLVSKRDALFQNAAVAQYTDASYAEFIFALLLAWSNGTLETHLFKRHQSNHHLLRSQEIKTHLFKRHQPNHLSLRQKHLTQTPVHT